MTEYLANQSIIFTAKNREGHQTPNIGLLEAVIEAKRPHAKPNTIKYYEATVAKLKAFLSHKEGAVLDEETCREFSKYLYVSMKKSSVRAYLQQLAALFNEACERGWLEQSPMPSARSLMPRRQETIKNYLTEDEPTRLCNTEAPRACTRRAFLFSCYTGLSLTDFKTFESTHIHHDGRGLVIVKPTTQGVKRIPICRQAMSILDEAEADWQPSDGDLLFRLNDPVTVNKDLRQWATNAGIDKRLTFSYGKNTYQRLVSSFKF